MTRDEAEALRANAKNWRWGIIYRCTEDSRLIVRNRFVFGWTWNFGHPRVFAWILIAAGFVVGIPVLLAAFLLATFTGLMLVFIACLLLVMAMANYIASGPR